MALLIYVIKIKQVLFSKLACCVYQLAFFCMKCPIKRRVLNIWKNLLFFLIRQKKWLISNCNSIANLCNKNKASAIFKTHVVCLSNNFLLHEMSYKKESIISKIYICLKNVVVVVKSYWWHMDKNIIYWENYVTQHEILCQVFKKK